MGNTVAPGAFLLGPTSKNLLNPACLWMELSGWRLQVIATCHLVERLGIGSGV